MNYIKQFLTFVKNIYHKAPDTLRSEDYDRHVEFLQTVALQHITKMIHEKKCFKKT